VKKSFKKFSLVALGWAIALTGCNGASSSSSVLPSTHTSVRIRFVDGAPLLETPIGSTPQSICAGASAPCYLQVNGQSVTQSFYYGSISPFVGVPSGTLALVARDEAGYAVGPLKTPPLAGGSTYTIAVIGSYPKYQVVAFAEPGPSSDARLSLYEASPSVPQAAFGSFRASSESDFKQRGAAKLGNVETVSLGKNVTDLGGYVGTAANRLGQITVRQIDSFDKHSALPFHVVSRLSLFLFDSKASSSHGPVFGALDQ